MISSASCPVDNFVQQFVPSPVIFDSLYLSDLTFSTHIGLWSCGLSLRSYMLHSGVCETRLYLEGHRPAGISINMNCFENILHVGKCYVKPQILLLYLNSW